jgi:hypothetical protein
MAFLELIQSYPVFINTILLGVVLVYWLLAMVGLLDFEHGFEHGGLEIDATPDGGGDIHHDGPGTVASWLVAFGLGGVPFSVVVSLLALFSWVLCAIAAGGVMPFVPTDILKLAVGTGILVGAFAVSLPITAVCVRPMRKLFVIHPAFTRESLVGRTCEIRSGSVDEHFGYARVVSENGQTHDIDVIADVPNTLKSGHTAFIVEYDESQKVFRVAEKNPF